MHRFNQPSKALVLFSLLSCIGFGCFFRGYFPVKPLVQGYTDAQDYSFVDPEPTRLESITREAPFSRLVFMLVDALRSDFVFGADSQMKFAQSLIESGQALPYTAVAQPPTVTLPRLKGLTTGSNPTFLDAILNIADEGSSSAALENTDSWIRQFAHRKGKSRTKMAFAGDDTWLRLFPPDWFAWSEGVSSFFVTDTRTVDSNVTRHLDTLLSRGRTSSTSASSDWDVLILHYLGLDHVGHLEGPKSSMMGPKQKEMDHVFERLFRATERRDQKDGEKSLLVLIGDHGMTEGGNHGGSTESETSSALLLAAPSLKRTPVLTPETHSSPYRFHEVVQQVDLVPTLSVLFNLGIPKNSMGRLIPSAVQSLRPSAFASGLSANVQQMIDVLRAAGTDSDRLLCQAATRLGRPCGGSKDMFDAETTLLFLKLAQDELLVSFGSYQMSYLVSAILAFSLSSIGFLRLSYARAREEERLRTKTSVGIAVVAHLASFFATSFIEEEHEYWLFATTTACVVLASSSRLTSIHRLTVILIAVTIRFMRGWSHNGQKDFPNYSITSFLARHPTTTTLLVGFTYLSVACIPLASLARASRSLATLKLSPTQLLPKAVAFSILATTISLQAVVGVSQKLLAHRSDTPASLSQALHSFGLDEPSTLARVGYVLGGSGWLLATFVRRKLPFSCHDDLETIRLSIVSLLLISLTRITNVPLFILFWLQHFALAQLSPLISPLSFSFLSIALQSCSFFALGGSNSLATVDLSQAYNGLSYYSFPLVTLLTYLSNFSGPIFFALSSRSIARQTVATKSRTIYQTTFFSVSLTTLAISAIHFRYHLFAFTVFSPAVLYKGIWWVALQLGTNEGLSRLILI